ncbi:MAG: TIGR01777 family oxidoreductase [Candidatus Baltobacteraceae bacterium]
MRVAVVGASGFIGRHVAAALRARGDDVVAASLRDAERAANACAGCDVVVNLAGEPIAQRWSDAVKQRIERSRVDQPRELISRLSNLGARPSAYISASAIGYYGTSETESFTESSGPGSDFLARVCSGWEREARRAADFGARVAIVRNGIALGTDGGALQKILPLFRLNAGGIIGSGKQWLSWIHIDDVVGIFLLAIDGAQGTLNATAPNPVTNAGFTRALADALHRPAVVPTPAFALRLMLGEGADMLLSGQRVLPERTQALGYRFAFTEISEALRALPA